MANDGRNPHEQDPLDILFADQRIGPAAKLVFTVLWRYAGSAPGRVCITAARLGEKVGGSPRAAWHYLDSLQCNDLIRVGERTRCGSIEIFIWHPCPGNREATPDPQQRLPLGHPSGAGDLPDDLADGSGGRATPPPGSAEVGEALGGFGAQTAECANRRGGFGAQTAEGVGGFGAQTADPKTANSPGNTAHAVPGSAVSARKPPRGSAVSARKPPSPSKNSKNITNSNSQVIKEFKEFNEDSAVCALGGFGAQTAESESFTAEARAVLEAGFAEQRSATSRPGPRVASPRPARDRSGEVAIGRLTDGIASALHEAAEPALVKARLVQRIKSAVGVPIAEWVAGMAANLVVYGEVPPRDLEQILIDLEARRARLENPAAWFHAQARKLAKRHGKRWPDRAAAKKAVAEP